MFVPRGREAAYTIGTIKQITAPNAGANRCQKVRCKDVEPRHLPYYSSEGYPDERTTRGLSFINKANL